MTKSICGVLGDDIGRISLLDFMGTDLATVNSARASYGVDKSELEDKDIKLINYLGEHHHETPLRHVYVRLHVKAPEFVARQWYKHIVGTEYSFKDLPWSEFSQRYSTVHPEFYVPSVTFEQSTQNKQASSQPTEINYSSHMRALIHEQYNQYLYLLSAGVSREQARIVLPTAMYTEWVWTASIQACVHFCTLRKHPGAQPEIQAYAKALQELVEPLAPNTWQALEKCYR